MTKKETSTVSDAILDLNVSYGNVNIGDKSARIGVTVSRDTLKVSVADKQLCEKRLDCCFIAKNGNPDQPTFDGMNDNLELVAAVDVKGFSVTADHISFGCTFALKSVDVQTLAKFAKREGRLMVTSIGEIEEGEEASEEADPSPDND